MNKKTSFEIILFALIRLGYLEDEAVDLIVDVIEEQKELDNISSKIHAMIDKDKKKTYS